MPRIVKPEAAPQIREEYQLLPFVGEGIRRLKKERGQQAAGLGYNEARTQKRPRLFYAF